MAEESLYLVKIEDVYLKPGEKPYIYAYTKALSQHRDMLPCDKDGRPSRQAMAAQHKAKPLKSSVSAPLLRSKRFKQIAQSPFSAANNMRDELQRGVNAWLMGVLPQLKGVET